MIPRITAILPIGQVVRVTSPTVVAIARRVLPGLGVAPTVTVALAETAYTAGQTLDASDIEPTIVAPGVPPLQLADLSLSLRVNGAPVSLPHVAVAGQVLVGRATWSHPAGAGSADSAPVTVGAAAAPVQVVATGAPGYQLQIISDDVGGDLTFTATIGGTAFGPFVRTAAQQISGVAVNHILPAIAETSTAGTYAATVGLWSHGIAPDPVPTYQWRRNGVAISGATSATYATTGADAGTTLTCAVTVAGVVAVSDGVSIPGAGTTVTVGTDGILISAASTTVTVGTDGILIAG